MTIVSRFEKSRSLRGIKTTAFRSCTRPNHQDCSSRCGPEHNEGISSYVLTETKAERAHLAHVEVEKSVDCCRLRQRNRIGRPQLPIRNTSVSIPKVSVRARLQKTTTTFRSCKPRIHQVYGSHSGPGTQRGASRLSSVSSCCPHHSNSLRDFGAYCAPAPSPCR